MKHAQVSQRNKISLNAQVAADKTPLAILESCLDEAGYIDLAKLKLVQPVNKSELKYRTLDVTNCRQFCHDAAYAVANNIIQAFPLEKPSFQIKRYHLKMHLDGIRTIVERGDLESGIALSLILHASKFVTGDGFIVFISLVRQLLTSKLQIVQPPAIEHNAKKMLKNKPLCSVLLADLEGLGDELDSIATVFVDFRDAFVRGWSAPSMVVVNVRSLTSTVHLEEPVALTALMGNLMRRVLEVKNLNDDLNAFCCFQPDPKEQDGSREPVNRARRPGLWFEVAAFGARICWDKQQWQPADLKEFIRALEEGIAQGRSPAVDIDTLIRRFSGFLAWRTGELLFDYDTAGPLEF